MSSAEIADNKWETQAAKPPIYSVAAVSQVLMMGALSFIFVYLLQGTLQGIFGEKRETMADNIGKMSHEASPAPVK
jgi:hypothetical protein